MAMSQRYSSETLQRTAGLIHERFNMSGARSEQLAAEALNGIDAHGLDPDDGNTVVATVDVVVQTWIPGDAVQ
jgi:hypothetical protein